MLAGMIRGAAVSGASPMGVLVKVQSGADTGCAYGHRGDRLRPRVDVPLTGSRATNRTRLDCPMRVCLTGDPHQAVVVWWPCHDERGTSWKPSSLAGVSGVDRGGGGAPGSGSEAYE